MKKFILALATALLAGATINAQESSTTDNTANKPYFGLRLGVDITCPGEVSADGVGVSVFDNGPGVEFGGIYNIPLGTTRLYLEPGLKLYYDQYSGKKKIVHASGIDSETIKKIGVRIPVNLGYRFRLTNDINLDIYTGPQFEIGFSAKDCVKAKGLSISESLYGDDGGMRRFDVLWSFGIGLSYQKFYFGLNENAGLVNMLTDSDGTFHENYVNFSIGYNF